MAKIVSLPSAVALEDDGGDETIAPIPAKPTTPRLQASVKKVAAILDFSERYVRDLCARGELEYTGRLRGFRIFLDSVAAYQERKRRAS